MIPMNKGELTWHRDIDKIAEEAGHINLNSINSPQNLFDKNDIWEHSDPYRIKVRSTEDFSDGIKERIKKSNGGVKQSFVLATENPGEKFSIPKRSLEENKDLLYGSEIASCDGSLVAVKYEQGILAAFSSSFLIYSEKINSERYGRFPLSIGRFITSDVEKFKNTLVVKTVRSGKEKSALSREMRKLELGMLVKAADLLQNRGMAIVDGPLFNAQYPGKKEIKKLRSKENLVIGDVKNPNSTIITSTYDDIYSERLGDKVYFTKKLDRGERSPWFLAHSPQYDVVMSYYKPRLNTPHVQVSRVEVPVEQFDRREEALEIVELGRRILASPNHQYSEWVRKAELIAKTVLPSTYTLRTAFEERIRESYEVIPTTNQVRYGGG